MPTAIHRGLTSSGSLQAGLPAIMKGMPVDMSVSMALDCNTYNSYRFGKSVLSRNFRRLAILATAGPWSPRCTQQQRRPGSPRAREAADLDSGRSLRDGLDVRFQRR